MRISIMRILPVLFLLAATPAHAELVFNVTAGSWSVFSTKDNCMAQNRPPSETGMVPINTLFVFAEPSGDTSIAMAFWPGAVTEKDHELTLLISGQGNFDLPAKALVDVWTMMRTTAPLPEDLVNTLMGRGRTLLYNMLVQSDVSDAVSQIDIQDMPKVMVELRHCVDLLQRAK
jgi:hypothetical protein